MLDPDSFPSPTGAETLILASCVLTRNLFSYGPKNVLNSNFFYVSRIFIVPVVCVQVLSNFFLIGRKIFAISNFKA